MGLRFLHASDIHLLDLSGVRFWRYFNKRATGGVNLLLRRGSKHDAARFDQIMEFAREQNIDRLVLTGDLTNLALEPEFVCVRDALAASGLAVTVIPGNHDTYTRGSMRKRRFEAYLGRFMEGEREGDHDYPFVQRFDDVALIGVSTAVPNMPLVASGKVGQDQLRRLAGMLDVLQKEGRTRIVLIHHPVMPGVSRPRHDLVDLKAFGAVIAEHGAELVLHGHEHRLIRGTLAGPGDPVPVHGISSGTARSLAPDHAACFSVYEADSGGLSRTLYAHDGIRFRAADPAR